MNAGDSNKNGANQNLKNRDRTSDEIMESDS